MPDNSDAPRQRGFPPPNADGTPALIGPDDYTRNIALERANRKVTHSVTGNYADIQRLVAQLAQDGKSTLAGTDLNTPNVELTEDEYVSPAQSSAAQGLVTLETIRTGLLTEAPVPDPPENFDANPVDPGAQSPTAEPKGKGSATSTTTTASTPKKA